MADINFNNVGAISSLDDSDFLQITSGGVHRKALVSTLITKAKNATLTDLESLMLDRLTDGCFILYYKTSNTPFFATASQWTALQNSGRMAAGVFIARGRRRLLIAPTMGTNLHWSSQRVLVNKGIMDGIVALNDFNGKEKTAAILADATIGGDGADYAPGFCAAYSRLNSDGYGHGAGRWWLPSLGELFMVMGNHKRINICMQLIDGGTQLNDSGGYLWSSTEYDTAPCWVMTPKFSYNAPTKDSASFAARPVSDLYS